MRAPRHGPFGGPQSALDTQGSALPPGPCLTGWLALAAGLWILLASPPAQAALFERGPDPEETSSALYQELEAGAEDPPALALSLGHALGALGLPHAATHYLAQAAAGGEFSPQLIDLELALGPDLRVDGPAAWLVDLNPDTLPPRSRGPWAFLCALWTAYGGALATPPSSPRSLAPPGREESEVPLAEASPPEEWRLAETLGVLEAPWPPRRPLSEAQGQRLGTLGGRWEAQAALILALDQAQRGEVEGALRQALEAQRESRDQAPGPLLAREAKRRARAYKGLDVGVQPPAAPPYPEAWALPYPTLHAQLLLGTLSARAKHHAAAQSWLGPLTDHPWFGDRARTIAALCAKAEGSIWGAIELLNPLRHHVSLGALDGLILRRSLSPEATDRVVLRGQAKALWPQLATPLKQFLRAHERHPAGALAAHQAQLSGSAEALPTDLHGRLALDPVLFNLSRRHQAIEWELATLQTRSPAWHSSRLGRRVKGILQRDRAQLADAAGQRVLDQVSVELARLQALRALILRVDVQRELFAPL